MSNSLYTHFYNDLMSKTIDLNADQINIALLDGTYTVDLANDTTYTAACHPSEIQTGILSGQSVTDGVFDADNFEFPNVVHGTNARYIVLYHDASDQLIAYFDTNSAGTIDIPCVGNDIHTDWNASGIFALANCP